MSSQEEELAPEILARRDEYFRRALHFLYFGINDKSQWLIVHPTANLQRERNTFRAAQLWKVIRVSDLLTLVGTFYSAGITFERPVEE